MSLSAARVALPVSRSITAVLGLGFVPAQLASRIAARTRLAEKVQGFQRRGRLLVSVRASIFAENTEGISLGGTRTFHNARAAHFDFNSATECANFLLLRLCQTRDFFVRRNF
jgi:hypothetical protein